MGEGGGWLDAVTEHAHFRETRCVPGGRGSVDPTSAALQVVKVPLLKVVSVQPQSTNGMRTMLRCGAPFVKYRRQGKYPTT